MFAFAIHVMRSLKARLQFIKPVPLSWIARGKFDQPILYTGQYYDPYWCSSHKPLQNPSIFGDGKSSHTIISAI